jgi:hypothetical protein
VKPNKDILQQKERTALQNQMDRYSTRHPMTAEQFQEEEQEVVVHHTHTDSNREGGMSLGGGNQQPYVKVLNMPKSSKDEAFARTREALVNKSTYNKLNLDQNKNI